MSNTHLADSLRLTEAGRQEILSAEAGGILVNPKSYKLGNFIGDIPDEVPSDLQGDEIEGGTGNIFYVEVLDSATVRFTLDISEDLGDSSGTNEGTDISELMLYTDGGVALCYAQLAEPYVKRKGIGIRIDAVLILSEGQASVINVTMSEHGSVPSVSNVANLPDPLVANVNAVSVLDLIIGADGIGVPGLAVKFGDGGQHWGFLGLERVFSGSLGGGNALSTLEFQKPTIVEAHELESGSYYVVQVVSGTGIGYTRRFMLEGDEGNETFKAVDEGFPELTDDSVISIWRQPTTSGNKVSTCPWPPNTDGIPKDWILSRGNVCPEWIPPVTANRSNLTKLYIPPSKLKIRPLTMVSSSEKKRYTLDNYSPKNGNYVLPSLQGVKQHRTAFEVWANYLEFSEELPNNIAMDIRLFTEEESTGTILRFVTKHYVSDGVTTRLSTGVDVDNPAEVFVFAGRIQQGLSSYILDKDTQEIVLTEPFQAGTAIEIASITYEQQEGFSTQIRTANFKITETTNILELPFYPENKDQVFITESGAYLHKDQYSIVGNRVSTTSDLEEGRYIEVMYFQNVKTEGTTYSDLPGVVTDIIPTSKGFQIIRHNEDPISLNMPELVLDPGTGISISGSFPQYKISSTLAEQVASETTRNFNLQQVVSDTVEVLVTQRVKFTADIIIQATGDFHAKLGSGFAVDSGEERIQYVLGFKSPGQSEPSYGRGIKGTGENGFSVIDPEDSTAIAHSNANVTQSWNLVKANHPVGYIDIVAKMRISGASLNNYGSTLTAGLNILVIPKLG